MGQFRPFCGGQFHPFSTGHFKPSLLGQFYRVFQLDEKIAAVKGTDSSSYFEKADYVESKYRLYNAINDELAADKAKMDKEEYEKEGQAVSGGRVQRAIRMS